MKQDLNMQTDKDRQRQTKTDNEPERRVRSSEKGHHRNRSETEQEMRLSNLSFLTIVTFNKCTQFVFKSEKFLIMFMLKRNRSFLMMAFDLCKH